MTAQTVSDDVRRLLGQHIESYEQLEIVLLLHRTRDVQWTAEAVGRSLNIRDAEAAGALATMQRRQIISVAPEPDGSVRYAYAPSSPADAAAVDQLAEAYATQRIEIMKLMNANAMLRVRTGALRVFADAFDLRKGPKNNG